MSLKKILFVALVAVSAVSMLADNSSAFFGLFRGGSHGSWGGGWGSRGGWGSCGSHGGYYSGSHGSWGSHGGGYGSHGSHGGGYGSGGGYYSAGYGGYGDGYYARRGGILRRYVVTTPVRETIVAQPVSTKTRLTLRVPAEATVTLAGVATKQTGEVRQFTTTRLASGQVWDDYKVVVDVEHNGQMVREERTISLTGGQAQELSIDFDSQQLAQR